MIFLVPTNSFINAKYDFGIFTQPRNISIPLGIIAGRRWAADNGAYSGKFDPNIYFPWLEKLLPFRDQCIFVTVPDRIGNAVETLQLFDQWHKSYNHWPLAFVAQDGQEDLDFPQNDLWEALFIGGSTEWKMSTAAIACITRAQILGKHIHIGRVNWYRRYQYFASLPYSENFTCDGTRIRFGHDEALIDWDDYMGRPKQYNLFCN